MNHNLKVLVLTTSYPIEGVTDAGHFVQSECAAILKKGVDVKVLAPSHPLKSGVSIEEGIEVTRFKYFFPFSSQKVAYGSGIPTNLKNSWFAIIQLPFFLMSFYATAKRLSKNVDIIHCHWFPAGLVGALIKKRSNPKLVLMMHHAHNPSKIYKWILLKTDYLFNNSNYTSEKISKIYQVPNQNILHLGINTSLFRPLQFNLKSKEIFQVLFVGRLIEWKGTEFLIRGFGNFLKNSTIKNARLVIIGNGPLKKKLEELTATLDITGNVVFKGYIPRNNLVEYFHNSDVFCIPSIKLKDGETEGLGLTAIEACACELPVIGSNTGGIPDIVEDGISGFIVEPGNEQQLGKKLLKLYNNEDLRFKMGKKGRQIILENFNLKNNAELIYNSYQLIMSKSRESKC